MNPLFSISTLEKLSTIIEQHKSNRPSALTSEFYAKMCHDFHQFIS